MRRLNRHPLTGFLTKAMALLMAGVAWVGVETPAGAQMILGGPSRPPISTKEFERFAGVLELDASQMEIARALFESMLADFEQIRADEAEHSEMLQQEFEETGDPAVFEDMMPVHERARKKTKELEARFMEDLRLVITDDQASNWDRLERMRRRDRAFAGRMGVAGASVDLLGIIDELELPEATRGEMAPVLERYEIDLDRALVERTRLSEEQEKQFREQNRPGEGGAMAFDVEAFQASAAAMREAETKLRDVNQRFAAQLGGMMDEPARAEFDKMVREASFPNVYRRSYAGRAFDRALGFDDLTDEQRAQLEAFREQYERELVGVNDRWASAVEESGGGGSQMILGGGNMVIQMGGESTDDAVRQARKAREDLDSRFYDRVAQLMTPEQAERLPRKRRGPVDGFFSADGLEGEMAVFVTQELMVDEDEDTSGDE